MHRTKPRSARSQRSIAQCIERMEPRVLLTAAVHHPAKHLIPLKKPVVTLPVSIAPIISHTKSKITSKTASRATPAGFGASSPTEGITPTQMTGAYLGTNFNFDGVTGDGTGETIAIVNAYDDPGMISSSSSGFATSDLAQFDAYYHLPNPPSFTKYGITDVGGTYEVSSTLPPPTGIYSGGTISWEMEESLDVEWAHVMAPAAKIVLIEADGDSDLFNGVQAADLLGGVNVVSMSWGFAEASLGSASNEAGYDSAYFGNSGITYLAATGDQGAFPNSVGTSGYPAASQKVVAVGGTSLTVSGISWSGETTWGNNTSSGTLGGSGGGKSIYTVTPSYQSSVDTSGFREYPDISLDGNPNTGVNIFDSYDFGATTPWINTEIGGTSLSSPLMAGIVAVADQGRALDNQKPLNSNGVTGGTDIHTLLYSLAGNANSYAADFHDIVSGNATGAAGPPPNFSPETGYDLASGIGSPVAGNLVFDLSGISPTLAVNQPATNSLYFKTDPSIAADTDVWVNSATPGAGTPQYKFITADIGSFIDNGNNESLTIILSNATVTGASSALTIAAPANSAFSVGTSYILGDTYVDFGTTSINFLNVSTLNLNPAAGSGNSVTINGTQNNDNFTVNSGSVQLNSLVINLTNLSNPILNPGTGTDALTVNSGTVSIASQTPGAGILTRNFSSISIASNGTAIFSTAALHTDRMLVETAALSVPGQLDLGGNDLVIHNASLAATTALLATGYANGQWNGKGIASVAAHVSTTHLTALGAIQNTLYGGSGQPLFDGFAPLATDVLVKYTYYGDANLDGKVDGTDYSRIDNAFVSGTTGWYNGDFNYDGSVNGSDYTLIDNAFNVQGAAL